jgi:hypothetical protein
VLEDSVRAHPFEGREVMDQVVVKKTELLAKVKANRYTHRDLFVKAQEGYRKEVIQELDRMLSDAKHGKPIRRAISLPEPIDRTKDYDRVIAMLEMSVSDEIELEEDDFDRYVLDNWDWKDLAISTNSQYI